MSHFKLLHILQLTVLKIPVTYYYGETDQKSTKEGKSKDKLSSKFMKNVDDVIDMNICRIVFWKTI